MKPRFLLPLALALAFLPGTAYANIYVPTLVDVISSPLLWSLYIVTLVITVPVILGIGYVETYTLRKDIAKGLFRSVWVKICVINALTSLIRLPFAGDRAAWPGLPVSYLLTIPAEALLISMLLKKQLGVGTARRALSLSARMNTASYAILSLVVLGLLYIPTIGSEHPEILRGVGGRIALGLNRVVDVPAGKMVIKAEYTSDRIGSAAWSTSVDSRSVATVSRDGLIQRHRIAGNRWKVDKIAVSPSAADALAVSGDARLILCGPAGKWRILDRVTGAKTLLPASIPPIGQSCFSPDGRYLAICSSVDGGYSTECRMYLLEVSTSSINRIGNGCDIVFNPRGTVLAWHDTKKVYLYSIADRSLRALKVRGSIQCARPAWSPDGRLLAYMGIPNPFATNMWTPELRAMDLETGNTALILRRVFTAGGNENLAWLR